MIWVLFQWESPWQRNDAHYVFYLSLYFYAPVFLRNRFREYVPAIIASIKAKFEQSLRERFGNILRRSFKNHKNSEIACPCYQLCLLSGFFNNAKFVGIDQLQITCKNCNKSS